MAKRTTTVKNPNDFEPIVVNGCLIEPNTIYEVTMKEPSHRNSPEIYKQLGSVKERVPGVSNTCSLSQSNSGFFDDSFSFNQIDTLKNDWSKRKEYADKYYEIFAAPMRSYIPEIERIRIPTDDEFFDKAYKTGYLTVNVGEGVQFNTANPVDRFKLYIAIHEGELAMKGKRTEEERQMGLKDENDMFNQDAQYSYVSITERKSRKEQFAEFEMESAYKFGEIMRKDRSVLIGMLSYINVPVKADSSTAELNTTYKTRIEPNSAKLKEFATMIERYEAQPDLLRNEFDLLDKVKSKKGRDLIKKDKGSFYYGDTPLGSNYKSVVSALLKEENADILKDFYLRTE